VLEADGRVVTANPAFAEIAGLAPEDVPGTHLLDLVHPDDVGMAEHQLVAAAAGNTPATAEFRHRRPDGTEGWAVSHLMPVEGGRALAHLVDITDRERARLALHAANHEIDQLSRGTTLALIACDDDGVVLGWNPAAERLLGWREGEVLGRPLPSAPFEGFHALHRQAVSGREFLNRSVTITRPDGTNVSARASVAPIRDAGRAIRGVVALITDAAPAFETTDRRGEQWLRKVIQNVSDTITVVDVDGDVTFTSESSGGLLGPATRAWRQPDVLREAHPADRERAEELLDRIVRTPGQELEGEFRVRDVEGTWETVELSGVNLLDDPDVEGIVLTVRNVSDRKRAENLLADQAAILELTARGGDLESILDRLATMVRDHADGGHAAIFVLNDDGTLGLATELGLPENVVEALAGGGLPIPSEGTDPVMTGRPGLLERAGLNGAWSIPVVEPSTGEQLGAISAYVDAAREPSDHERRALETAGRLAAIAVARRRSEERLSYQSLYDNLTGLPNRTLMMDRLTQALHRSEAGSAEVGVLFVDIDRFQVANDSLGHGAGDQLLIAFSDRLREAVRPEDTVARFGGDGFVVVLEGVERIDDARHVANRVLGAMREPFQYGDHETFLTASIGVAVGRGGTDSADVLMRHADVATRRAKRAGRDRLVVFDPAWTAGMENRLHIESGLRHALERDELYLRFQPTIDLESGTITGVEALLRWSHPERGLVWPNDFVPVAEETGAIVPIGAWVLDEALRQASAWDDGSFVVSVNLSARQLGDHLVPTVIEALERHRWPAERLMLELTESVLMEESAESLRVLDRLKELGLRLAIDDFGTGFSSLAYLDRLPFDVLKIDRSFIERLGSTDDGRVITATVIRLARALGLITVAEGVETRGQSAVLQSLGCDWAQGIHFAHPLTPPEVGQLLAH